jgi:hypothetical protein
MPLASNTANYSFGKAKIYFKRTGETGFLYLGQIPACELLPEIETHEEFDNTADVKLKLDEWILTKKLAGSVELKEYSPENLQMAGMATAITSTSQTATTLDGTTLTTITDRFISVGNLGGLSYKKISIGTVTGDPFEAGETITGTSTETAKIIDVQTGYLLVIADSGLELTDTITGGTSSASAPITGIETISGAMIGDAATAATLTKIYTAGTDYDFDAMGGLIRELTGGTIAAHTSYIYADVPAKTLKKMYTLSGGFTEGQLLIVGNTKDGYGPKMRFESWDNGKARLKPTGGIKMISETPESLTFDIEILSDANTYPNSPFGTFTVIE